MKKATAIALIALAVLASFVSCGKKAEEPAVPVHPLLEGFVEKDEYDGSLLNQKNGTVTVKYLANAVLNSWNENAIEVAKETQTVRYYVMSATGHSSGGKWGDAHLLVFPNGQTMLIDAGMSGFGAHLTRNLVKLGITKIDYLIFSHMHDDHTYGILDNGTFLSNIEVGVCYWNGCLNAGWGDQYKVEHTMKPYGIDVEIVSEGFEWWIGDVQCRVLGPSADWVGQEFTGDEAVNGTSIILRIDYKDNSFLFSGDLYSFRETQVLEQYADTGLLDVDVLKLDHHGTAVASCAAWITATSPKIAVATGSGGIDQGIYGRLAKIGCYGLMECIDGYIRIVADGTNITFETSREREISTYAGYDKVRDNVLAAAAASN